MTTLVRASFFNGLNWIVLALGSSLVGFACSPGSTPPPAQTGGASGTGGNPVPGTGGISGGVGGAPTTGGAENGAGGGSGGSDPSTGGSGDGGGSSTGGAGSSTGGGSGIENYNPEFKEFVGEDCTLPDAPTLSQASHSLPDPFLMSDGARMSSMSQWACQRAWLKKNIESHVYGAKHGRPTTVTGTVSNTSINVQIQGPNGNASYSVSINLPPDANGPVPGMFQAEGSGVPTNFLHDEGVAAMSYQHAAAESAYNAVNGNAGSEPIKWAWAVSRAIDVLVDQAAAGQNDIIDPTALGTTGCSYAGKSAFVVGAFDERIALGIPMESGTGGLGSYRVVGDNDLGPNGGENPEQVSEACGQGWFTGTVCNNADAVPGDAHFVVAMYAPRGFTTLDNNRIGHLGPVAQYTAAAAGAEVFKALGIESHVGYHGGNDGDPHMHCSFNQSQRETAQKAIRGFLTKTEPPANFMEPKLRTSSDQPITDWDLDSYIDWETPTLAP